MIAISSAAPSSLSKCASVVAVWLNEPRHRRHKSSRRASLIASQVDEWYPLDDQKWVANVPKALCHRYYRRTQTVVLCWYNTKSNMFKHALLVCSLLDLDLFEINHVYDERARIETEIRADKDGLLLPKRRKKQLEAQEALTLLTDLAHNILAWSRDFWAAEAKISDLGIYGIVNQIMMIPGKLRFEDGKLVKARLQATHPLAKPWFPAFRGCYGIFESLDFPGSSGWRMVKRLD